MEQITISPEIRRRLKNEIPSIMSQIRRIYSELDKKTGLHSTKIPITFGYETDLLGSYTPKGQEGKQEQFHFSLLFVGYLSEGHLHMADKVDLYKHEYAHFMQYNMEIPEEHLWQSGKHGSAWKYCCSIVGCAPTPYYSFGKGHEKHDYKKVLKNPWKDPHLRLLDEHRREVEYRNKRDSAVKFSVGDSVEHPKFGQGTVEKVEPLTSSVILHIQFADLLRKIDQKWLVMSRYKRAGDK